MEFAEIHKDFLKLAKEYAEGYAERLAAIHSTRAKKTWRLHREKIMAGIIYANCNPEVRAKRKETLKRVAQDPEVRAKRRESMRRAANTPRFIARARERMTLVNTPEYRSMLSQASKRRWEDAVTREKMITYLNTPEHKQAVSDHFKRLWSIPEYRAKMCDIICSPERIIAATEKFRTFWDTQEFRTKHKEGIKRRDQKRELTKDQAISSDVRNQVLTKIHSWCNEQYGRQAKLAKILGVCPQALYQWLSKRKDPTLRRWLALKAFADQIESGNVST